MNIKEMFEVNQKEAKVAFAWSQSIASTTSIIGCVLAVSTIVKGEPESVKVFMDNVLNQIYEREKKRIFFSIWRRNL